MIGRGVLAIPMAFAWMLLTANISLESFGVGFVLSFAVLWLVAFSDPAPKVTWRRLPDKTIAAIVYMVILLRDICLSAIDVARRVIDPAMPLNPGIIAVPTQIESAEIKSSQADTLAAVSAHGITITPGELVVDFEGNRVMYVHCLDVVASVRAAETNQARRVTLLRRIFDD